MALTKMTIRTDNPVKKFTVKINPASIKFSKSIKYNEPEIQGDSKGFTQYDAHSPSNLDFDFILDSTGIAYDREESISETINTFEEITCKMNGSSHKPNDLTINWGTFIFKCHLKSLSYDYTLFSPEGEPLRVKASVSFIERTNLKEIEKEAGKSSPDMTHVITLKAGENIAWWCNRIYGDASYCTDVARYNRLTGFRNVPPGTQLVFPPLIRNL